MKVRIEEMGESFRLEEHDRFESYLAIKKGKNLEFRA